MARPNVSKRSRKRARGKGRSATATAATATPPPAPAPAAPRAKSRSSRPRPSSREKRERPPAPWGAFPLTELAILVGLVGAVVGFTRGNRGTVPLFVGVGVAGIAVLEVSWREHRTGFRSHTVLLAFAPVVIFTAIMSTVLGPVWTGAVALAGGIPLFSFLFWHLRRIWHEAQLRRPY